MTSFRDYEKMRTYKNNRLEMEYDSNPAYLVERSQSANKWEEVKARQGWKDPKGVPDWSDL